MNDPVLGPIGIKALQNRGIRPETAIRFGIYTAREGSNATVVPDYNGNVIAFPFFENERVVAEKYRAPRKRFWQRKGGKRIFWNYDAVEIAAEDPGHDLIITEGELDALTAIDCGFENTCSVPDGAPAQEAKPLEAASREEEQRGKFAFMWHARAPLKRIKSFILAVDSDEPGQVLAAELVRRLGASRCCFVEYPPDCKDLSDVRVKCGPEAVAKVLNTAKRYPVRGIYTLADYPETPPLEAFSTGFANADGLCVLDQHLKLFPGELMVVTGVPGHGKSTWVLNLAANMERTRGWRTAVFSPEMPVMPMLRDKLRRMHIGRPYDWTLAEKSNADDWINDAFVFIDGDPKGEVATEEDDEQTLAWIMDKAADTVMRFGTRMLIIDPWNEIEHCRRRDETSVEYIGRGLRDLRRFARDMEVVVIVVAHPTKDIITPKGQIRRPTLYDVDGAAHWANKPDHGVTIWRKEDGSGQTEIHVSKVRFVGASGDRGTVKMRHVDLSDTFEPLS